MDETLISAVVDFEVYLLLTMKPRLSLADTRGLLEAKLTDVGLSMHGAIRIHDRIAESLCDETSRFREMKALLGFLDDSVISLNYSSVLWPGFEFNAHAGLNGLLESAGYTHTERTPIAVESPIQVAAWSVDLPEFAERFGPAVQRGKRPLFDDILPAYEELEFLWKGDRYGAGFLWGLFVTSSAYWE